MRYHQGRFKIKNRDKYVGDPNAIYYRSGWEFLVFMKMDHNPDILQWASEEVIIPYISPVDRKIHRYFPDVWFRKADGIYVIEIKPENQTSKPVLAEGKKNSRSHKQAIVTYAVNQAKWEAAERFCDSKGWKFQILTERQLFGTPKT